MASPVLPIFTRSTLETTTRLIYTAPTEAWAEVTLINMSALNVAVGPESASIAAGGLGSLLPTDIPVKILVAPGTKIYGVASAVGAILSVISQPLPVAGKGR